MIMPFITNAFVPLVVSACTGPSTYTGYKGECTCGSMEATRLEQQIVFHEIKRNIDTVGHAIDYLSDLLASKIDHINISVYTGQTEYARLAILGIII